MREQLARLGRKLRVGRAMAEPDDDMASVFGSIFKSGGWKNEENQESVSGRGSTLARTEVIRTELPTLLARLGVRTIIDAGCGDFNWLRAIDLPVDRYLGVDIVPGLVDLNRKRYESAQRRFDVWDITSQTLPLADAILCRECLVHLSFAHVLDALTNFKNSGATFLIAMTHSLEKNEDIVSGQWRFLNLQLPPISLPEPDQLLVEDASLGKHLGVWRLDLVRLQSLRS